MCLGEGYINSMASDCFRGFSEKNA